MEGLGRTRCTDDQEQVFGPLLSTQFSARNCCGSCFHFFSFVLGNEGSIAGMPSMHNRALIIIPAKVECCAW
jgi:hypothetical protein